MRRFAVSLTLLSVVALGGCDYMPQAVKTIFSKNDTILTGAFKNGSFKGQLKVLFLEPKTLGDRNVQLLEPFGYKDSKGIDWDVPAGATSDGASIPWQLWPWLGGPFDGAYRDAAIIHDYYCQTKSRKWEDVHLMFLEAALKRGVPEQTANVMYAGILLGGPTWSAPLLKRAQVVPGAPGQKVDPGVTNRQATDAEKQQMEELKRWIETAKPTPEEIKKRVDQIRKTPPSAK